MVPNINSRGHSFKGVSAYLMHDKEADTSERVMWSTTHNLHTDDVELAARYMAWTDINRDQLKADAGVSPAGRHAEAGNVYHYSVSWSPDEAPTRKHMEATALASVERLGLQDHQHYLVGHDDTDKLHVHVVVNLVDHNTGKIANVYKDREILDRWSNEYEQEHGIKCQARDDKYQSWENDKQAFKERDDARKAEQAEIITEAFHMSDSGKAFNAALGHYDMTLAQGSKRGFVVVDHNGNVMALNRAIEGVKSKDINVALSDIDKAALPFAGELIDQRRHYDRDAQELAQQDALAEAAEQAAQVQVDAEDKDATNQAKNIAKAKAAAREMSVSKEEAYEAAPYGGQGFNPLDFDQKRAGYIEAAPDLEQQIRKDAKWAELRRAMEDERVLTRQAVERVDARRDYWQLDRLEGERDQAQQNLDDHSGWIYRYVFRGRHQEAQNQLDAAEKAFDHARDRWRQDIEAVYEERPAWMAAKVLRENGFEDSAAQRMEQFKEQAALQQENRARETQRLIERERERDEQGQEEPQQKLQRDMTPDELDAFRAQLMEQFKERAALQQENRARETQRLVERDRERNEQRQEEPQQKLQRDMTPDELDAFRDKLMNDMQAKLNEQYQARDYGHDDPATPLDRAQEQEPANDHEDPEKLQRDMEEAELEAARAQAGERIAEAGYGFEDGEVSRGRDDDPELER